MRAGSLYPYWAASLGLVVGFHVAYRLWLTLVLWPLAVDPDLVEAYYLIAGGRSTGLRNAQISAAVVIVVCAAGVLGVVHFARRLWTGPRAFTILAVAAASLLAFSVAGFIAGIPGGLLSIGISDFVDHSETQIADQVLSTVSGWANTLTFLLGLLGGGTTLFLRGRVGRVDGSVDEGRP